MFLYKGYFFFKVQSVTKFSKLSVTSPTSQLILQPYFRFSYITGSSLTSPGEPPMNHSENQMKLHADVLCNISSMPIDHDTLYLSVLSA